MEHMSRKITLLIKNNNNNSYTDLDLKKIEFGLTTIISELSKTIAFLLIFSLFSLAKYFLTAFFFLGGIRFFAGGYHDKTYWRCFFTSLTLFSSILLIGLKMSLSLEVKIVILLFSLGLILVFAPVDHPNKPIISNERKLKYKLLSIIITTIFGFLSLYLPYKYQSIAIVAILFEAISLPMGIIANKSLIKNNSY